MGIVFKKKEELEQVNEAKWATWTLMSSPFGLRMDKRPGVIFVMLLLLLFKVEQGTG